MFLGQLTAFAIAGGFVGGFVVWIVAPSQPELAAVYPPIPLSMAWVSKALGVVVAGPIVESLILVLVMVFVSPVFRGNAKKTIAITALMFASAHAVFSWQWGLVQIFGGLAYATAAFAYSERGLYYSIFAAFVPHSLNNAAWTCFVLLTGDQ